MSHVVGIDVGTSAVKAVSLQATRDGYKLKSLAVADVRRPEFHPNEGGGSALDAAARALERIVQDRNFAKKMCACSSCGPRVAQHLFQFPRLNEKEIPQAVRIEAEAVLPFSLNDAVMDYLVFGEVVSGGEVKTEGLVVAIHQDEVKVLFDLLRAAGLRPVVFDIDALAIANCYLETVGQTQRQVTAILNLGARLTNLSILHGDNRVFARDVAAGGDMVSRSISTVYGVDIVNAEQRKYELIEEFPDADRAPGSDPDDDVILVDDEGGETESDRPVSLSLNPPEDGARQDGLGRILHDSLDELAREVSDTFRYYVNRRIIPKVDQLLLTGGTSKVPGMALYFQEELKVPTRLWNPLEGVDCSPLEKKFPEDFVEEFGPHMGVALGLAMRQV